MKIIHDPLYQDIRMSDVAIQIINTPLYERLNYIRQTSMAYRVFPSATHTRKTHQIGVYGLAKKTLDTLILHRHLVVAAADSAAEYMTLDTSSASESDATDSVAESVADSVAESVADSVAVPKSGRPLSPEQMTQWVRCGHTPSITTEEYEWICIGGLVHDLGHGPSSHSFDDLVEEFVENGLVPADSEWVTHERRGQYLFRHLVKRYQIDLSDEAVDYICQVIEPSDEYIHDFRFQLINNKVSGIDLDKMDYIKRDNYEFGLCCSIDIDRIITNSGIHCQIRNAVNSEPYTYQSTLYGSGRDINDILSSTLCELGVDIGTYWSFCDRICGDIFNLFMVRYRLYKEIYNHPKVIKFELAYLDVLKDQGEAICQTINRMDVDRFMEMTDESMLWTASKSARDRFHERGTYRLSETTGLAICNVRVTRTVGFFGKNGFNPFKHIRFYDRKSGKIKHKNLNEISVFLNGNNTCENLVFDYTMESEPMSPTHKSADRWWSA
jgi:HD superfamily phosphohydrolase